MSTEAENVMCPTSTTKGMPRLAWRWTIVIPYQWSATRELADGAERAGAKFPEKIEVTTQQASEVMPRSSPHLFGMKKTETKTLGQLLLLPH